MKSFLVRPTSDSKIIFISGGANTIQLDVSMFSEFEPSFSLGENI